MGAGSWSGRLPLPAELAQGDHGGIPGRIHHPRIAAAAPGVETRRDCRMVGTQPRFTNRQVMGRSSVGRAAALEWYDSWRTDPRACRLLLQR